MDRFAILKEIPPPPFKDKIAEEIAETVNRESIKHRYVDREPLSDPAPRVQQPPIRVHSGVRAQLEREARNAFLEVTSPSGRHYQIQRDQIHIHQQGGSHPELNPQYELHLNLPDNLAVEIWNELNLNTPPYGPSSMHNFLQQERERIRRSYISHISYTPPTPMPPSSL